MSEEAGTHILIFRCRASITLRRESYILGEHTFAYVPELVCQHICNKIQKNMAVNMK